MSSVLSQYLPSDSPALRKEFETAYADVIGSLYERFRAEKALARLRESYPEAVATPVDELDLPSRTVTALKRKGIDTVYDLLPLSEEDLARVKGISYESAAEIIATIDSF